MNRTIAKALLACGAVFSVLQTGPATAGGTDPYLGQIMWVPYNYAPTGWAKCDGQLLSIAQNAALFSLLGTSYGGDGRVNFALPDMRGKIMVKDGQGLGLSPYTMGQTGGEASHTLTINEMPSHNHTLVASTNTATATSPSANVLAQAASGNLYSTNPTATTAATPLTIAGGGQAHNNMMPYTTLNCIIALNGVFPSRP